MLLKVEREVIDQLDEIISEGRGDDEYKQLFTDMYVTVHVSSALWYAAAQRIVGMFLFGTVQ